MVELSNIQKTTPTVTEPVELLDQKAFMRVDHDDDDDLIEDMITAAREDIERETDLALVDSSVSFDVDLDYWDSDKPMIVKLPYARNIDTIVVTDLNNNDEEVTDDNYTIRGNKVRFDVYGFMNIEYDIEPVVPQSLKEAIMMLVAYRYNNRGDQEKQQGLPEDINDKVSKYREVWL